MRGVDACELEDHAVAVVGGRNRIGQSRGEGQTDQVDHQAQGGEVELAGGWGAGIEYRSGFGEYL